MGGQRASQECLTGVFDMVSSSAINQQDVYTELRPSPNWVAGLLVVSALTLNFVGDTWFEPSKGFRILLFQLALYVVSAVIWGLNRWFPQVSRWTAVMVMVVVIILGLVWLGTPGFLALATLPILVSVALLGVAATVITATIQTTLLLVLSSTIPLDIGTPSFIIIVTVWVTLGIMYVIFHPIREIIISSVKNYQQAQSLLEETRLQKAQLQQALDDLALANREMMLLNEKVTAMRHVAEDAQKAKTSFVAKVSHEFRTPLNMIIGLTDVLIEKPEVAYGDNLPEALLEDLKIVHRNCEHLSNMVNDVLDLSQTEMGRLTLHRDWVDLSQDIYSAVSIVQPLLEKKNLDMQTEIPEDLPQVYCDRTRIRQVILNLVSNAARYTEQGSITVSAKQENRYVVISVQDTGPGIASADAEKIFDPFFQVGANLWHDQEGSGLGLSISKQFVERHDGEIWLESEPGVGSTFFFKIPLSPPTAPVGGAERWLDSDWVFKERTSRPQVPQSPYKERIVLCDETGDLHALFAAYSDSIEFVDTRNLSEASHELQDCPAHAVILNTVSPDNLALVIEQARVEIPDTLIIGCSLPPRVDHAYTAGATKRLTKPVRQVDLEETIQSINPSAKRILIVDDNPDVLQLFKRMLIIYNNTVEVTMASNGGEALHEMRTHPPDLVLLDIVMPVMDGWQVLEQQRQDEAIKNIPIVVMSAEDVIEQTKSDVLMTTMGTGLSVSQVLHCSVQLSKLLFESS